MSTDNIDSQLSKLNPTLNYIFTSDLPTQEYLNQTSASRIRPGSRFTATISPHDSQSFTTDHQQIWPTQPQSPRLPTPSSNTIPFSDQDSNEDFVLFPTTAGTRPQARTNSELAQATSHTAPNFHRVPAHNGQQFRRNSTQQYSSSVSPIQNPRVSGIIHGTGSSSSSPSMQYNSPTGQKQQHRLYANSAPSSTTVLHQQSPRMRPPVPLFSNSTGNLTQDNNYPMAHSHLEGTSTRDGSLTSQSELTTCPSDVSSSDTMFDFSDYTNAAPDAHSDGHFDSSLDFSTQFESINHPAAAQASNVQTVSPKDLMVDTVSAPPSGAFTDLTTPGTSTFESPYMANSNETSPMFAEEAFGDDPDHWPSLFDPVDEAMPNGSLSHFTQSPTTTHVAPKMSRNASSPGQTSARSSTQGRHSFASGVAPRRRDKPLPAITIEDPNDTVAVKRARNTLAARKSREKRQERTEALLSQVNMLEEEVEKWKNIALSMGHVE